LRESAAGVILVDMTPNPSRRPGDLLLDRWMPNATPLERERAHENLRAFAQALLKIAIREVREETRKFEDLEGLGAQ
jgi:hypothetical protein